MTDTEAAIWERVLQPEQADLSAEGARAWLQLRVPQHDLERMHELAGKNQQGALSQEEHAELDTYLRVGLLLDLMQAKARLTLTKRSA